MTVLTKNPNGDSSIQLDPQSNNYAQVNDVDDATFVGNNETGSQYDLYTLDGGTVPAGATINKVTLFYRCRYVVFISGGSSSGAGRIKTHGVEYAGNAAALTTSWVNLQSDATHWTVNPNTGVAWTPQEITDLLAGPNLYTSDINRRMSECAKFYVEVDYTVAGGTAYTKTCSEILGLKDALGARTVKAYKGDILGLKDSLGPRSVKVSKLDVLGLKDSFSTRRGFVKIVSEILGMVDSVSHIHTPGLGLLLQQAGQWAKRKLPPFPRDLLLALRDYLKVKTEGYDTLANTHKEGQIIRVSSKTRIEIVGLGREKPNEGKDDS